MSSGRFSKISLDTVMPIGLVAIFISAVFYAGGINNEIKLMREKIQDIDELKKEISALVVRQTSLEAQFITITQRLDEIKEEVVSRR